jgi:hypothetical protein
MKNDGWFWWLIGQSGHARFNPDWSAMGSAAGAGKISHGLWHEKRSSNI